MRRLAFKILFGLVFCAGSLFAQDSSKGVVPDSPEIATEDYYESGGKKSEGKVVQVDYWIYYHENGKKESEGSYTYGRKDSTWTYFDEKETRPVKEITTKKLR